MINYFLKKNNEIKTCEDSLTSSVFDLLKYLPSEIFWRILKGSLYFDKLPSYYGGKVTYTFWPKWNAKDTNNSRFVEPDLFLQCHDFDIIIEAKRNNEKQQYEDQKENQLKAYFNEFKLSKKIYYIQVGGLNDLKDDDDIIINNNQIVSCKTDWSQLLNKIVEEYYTIKDINLIQLDSYKRIFEDLKKCLERHGYYKKSWLQEIIITEKIYIDNFKNLFDYAKRGN